MHNITMRAHSYEIIMRVVPKQTNIERDAILVKKGIRVVHTIVLQYRTWILIFLSVNFVGETMPNYYIFKGKRPKEDYISLCEDGACMGMQENRYMIAQNFSK